MSIECYYHQCPNHEANHLAEDVSGPFCNNNECTASGQDMVRWGEERLAWLQSIARKSEEKGEQ